MNEGVILLVEDDQSLAELSKLGLLEAEFTNEVVLARDGEEAVEYLLAEGREAEEMPCLVLLDLHMPRMDGFGVLRRLRSEERTRLVPVVMLSSSEHPEDVRTAYEEGANAYLAKVPERVPWPEQIQTVARFWLGLNLSAHS
jgi:two-component system, response regulator